MSTSTNLPILQFITNDSDYIDYRPAIGPDGDTVIFERTEVNTNQLELYKISISNPGNCSKFLSSNSANFPLPIRQSRPDWCWEQHLIAFNGADTTGPVSVYYVEESGANPSQIAGTEEYVYPTWDINAKTLVCENNFGTPSPCNTTFALSDGTVVQSNINGYVEKTSPPLNIYGGMPAVGSNSLPAIAFAGQVIYNNNSEQKYDQCTNYIWMNRFDPDTENFYSAPMEPGAAADLEKYDGHFQGRAPAYSPDGNVIAFESNRAEFGNTDWNCKNYAIYLYNLASQKLTQVTRPSRQAQHAKFFPCGTKLILCSHHPEGGSPTRGIAWVDISALL